MTGMYIRVKYTSFYAYFIFLLTYGNIKREINLNRWIIVKNAKIRLNRIQWNVWHWNKLTIVNSNAIYGTILLDASEAATLPNLMAH